MSPSLPTGELRRAVSLFATEWWVLVGGVVGYLAYGVWVVATGVAFRAAEPTVATAVGSLPLSAPMVFAALVWLLLPAAVAAWLLSRRYSNEHGNLRERYRFDHPSALLWPPGIVLLGCLGVTLTIGRARVVTLIASLASVFVLVRTIAYGYRVYTLSVPRLFSLLALLSGIALSAAWLVQATIVTALGPSVGNALARAGVDAIVETGTAAAGVTPAAALAALVGVPAVLSTAYLLVQSIAGMAVRQRAPLANPVRRPGQRFPVMSPVAAENAQQNSRDAGSTDADTETASDSEPSHDASEPSTADAPSQTRVFTPDEDAPADNETRAVHTDTAESTDDWDDDTSVFSPERAGCGNCGRAVPEAASVCPNCGERVED